VRDRHIGVAAFQAERLELLARYDVEKARNVDEAVRTSHGVEAECILREWLDRFLPKRFAVAKGWIITTRLDYDGPQEEWDIIVYDALNSPVLFASGPAGSAGQKRAIPVEHVRAVVEVKATLNPSLAKQSATKLERLVEHIGVEDAPNYPKYLKAPFCCCSVFFETAVDSLTKYRRALNEIAAPIGNHDTFPFLGSLVLRSRAKYANPDHSGYLKVWGSEEPVPIFRSDNFEMSDEFRFSDGRYGQFGTVGWSVNSFQAFVFDFLACLTGTKTNLISSFYGLGFDIQSMGLSRLFSPTRSKLVEFS
jgi:Domain of unknown function (DUF6602)